MDRESFNIIDEGYQQDRQNLLDKEAKAVSPEYDKQLEAANRNYVQRTWNIRNSNYSFAERQRIEQQELEAYKAKQAAINAAKEEELERRIAEKDQQLQKILFNGRMRDEIHAELNAQEKQATQQQEQKLESVQDKPTTDFNNASRDSANVADFENVSTSESDTTLSSDFNTSAQSVDAAPTPESGQGPGMEP